VEVGYGVVFWSGDLGRGIRYLENLSAVSNYFSSIGIL
jgi:hypothetical protein